MAASIIIALGNDPHATAGGLACGLALAAIAHLPGAPLLGRMAIVNLFMVFLAVFLPPGIPGREAFSVGPFAYSIEGLRRAGLIAMKTNSLVLVYTALVSTMRVEILGHALAHFRAPKKLILLYLLMIRYINTLHGEYSRLRMAMRARCFAAGPNLHTMKTCGELAAVILLRGFHRSRRVLAAMKCRCWKGEYWLLHHFTFSARDAAFVVICAIFMAAFSIGHLR
jgi:cobalt/nickel transport system permease protein